MFSFCFLFLGLVFGGDVIDPALNLGQVKGRCETIQKQLDLLSNQFGKSTLRWKERRQAKKHLKTAGKALEAARKDLKTVEQAVSSRTGNAADKKSRQAALAPEMLTVFLSRAASQCDKAEEALGTLSTLLSRTASP